MTTIQIRIDEKTKRSAKRVFGKLGIDMSTAIKVFLKQVVTHNGIPMRLVTENGITPAEERAILKADAEARRGKNVSGPFASVDEMFADLDA